MENLFSLPRTAFQKALKYWRKLWVRVILMGLFSFFALGLALLLEQVVPTDMRSALAGSAADRLLDIIANAMLAVTIFSLTVMVSVYRSSSTQWTPRVHRLIMQDATTQNTLATFVGAYVYALVAIILREVGIFSDDRALVLFAITVIVLCLIVFSLVRWVLHLQTLGSLLHTTRQIEEITTEQFKERLDLPCLGANPLTEDVPDDAEAYLAPETGYVRQVYPEALNVLAETHGVEIYLPKTVGDFVFVNAPTVFVSGTPDDKDTFKTALWENVLIGDLRSYEQDPRFGLTVLGEIGSKALSPGINDPGTAIDVITRIGRILSHYTCEESESETVTYTYLHVPPMDPYELLRDSLSAVARDGAALVEVQIRLQATLAGLMRHPAEDLCDAARRHADELFERVSTDLPDADRARLKDAMDRHQDGL